MSAVDSDKELRTSYSVSDDDGTLRVGSLEIGTGGVEGAPGIDMIKEHMEKDAMKMRRMPSDASSGSLLSTSNLQSPKNAVYENSFVASSGDEDDMAAMVAERKRARRARRKGQGRMQTGVVLLDIVGKGNGGRVYKAIHVPTLRVVAVKQFKFHDGSRRKQMRRELDTLLCGLEHPNIVQFYDSYATQARNS